MPNRVRHAVIACALTCAAATVAQASTIIKLNLGGIGPDVGMTAGVMSTIDQTGGPPPTGDQLTDVEYTGFLDFIPDINTNSATFSLDNVAAVGPATVIGSLVVQNFTGGVFSLYDAADTLLLQGPLANSALAGVLGPPGTGSLFTTTLGTVTGGSLAAQLAPGTVSVSMTMINVNGGAGFSVSGGGPQLNNFLTDASLIIAADPLPEPSSLTLLGLGSAFAMARSRRRQATK